jgi:hypothetical protein
MIDVPALKVKFEFAKKSTGVEPLNVNVDDPRLIVRVLLLLEDREVAVTLKLLVVNVPCVTVSVPEDVNASPSVTMIPDPLIVTGPSVLPALVNVPVPLNVVVPVYVTVIPADRVRDPDMVSAGVFVPAHSPVNPVQLMDFATREPLIVHLAAPPLPSFASKNTSSAAVGTA